MHIVMLRDIDANELDKKKLAAGDYFYADWVPGTGTTVGINDKAAGEPIKEPEFFTALMEIWLGKAPTPTRDMNN